MIVENSRGMEQDISGFNGCRIEPPEAIAERLKEYEQMLKIKFVKWSQEPYRCHVGETVQLNIQGGGSATGFYNGLTTNCDYVILPLFIIENHGPFNDEKIVRNLRPRWGTSRAEFVKSSAYNSIEPVDIGILEMRIKSSKPSIIVPWDF